MNQPYDIAIIGAGIAGVSAAVYAKRAGLSFTIYEPNLVGGQLMYMEEVDNYVGLGLGCKGRDLASELEKTLAGLEISLNKNSVKKLEKQGDNIIVFDEQGQTACKGVVIATGAGFKQLGLSGETALLGKGVSYCAICDGFFFRKKTVAVIGGGNTAIEDALYLANICQKVYLIHRRDSLRALDYLQKKIAKVSNIEIIYNTVVNQINGTQKVQSLSLENTNTKQQSSLIVDGVFVAIGVIPATDLVKDLVDLDKYGFIITDEKMKTSLDNVWACGDCRLRPLRQLITAASEGAIAAVSAYTYLKGSYLSV